MAEWERTEAFVAALNHPELVRMRDATPFRHVPALYEVVGTSMPSTAT